MSRLNLPFIERLDSQEWLREQYLENGLSTASIGEILNCSSRTVLNRLHACGIPTRSGNSGESSGNMDCLELRIELGKRWQAFNKLYNEYRINARKKGICFEFSREEFHRLAQERCFYCGTMPAQQRTTNSYPDSVYTFNGIDRYDNTIGYIIKNVVPCCSFCNYMKKDLHGDAFLTAVENIHSWSPNNSVQLGEGNLSSKSFGLSNRNVKLVTQT